MEYERFPIYEKALSVAENVKLLCDKMHNREYGFIKDQLLRASSSVVLNIAEGAGKWSKKDKMNFYRISRGSAYESCAAIDLMLRYRLIDKEKASSIKNELFQIYQGLNNLMSSIDKRRS